MVLLKNVLISGFAKQKEKKLGNLSQSGSLPSVNLE